MPIPLKITTPVRTHDGEGSTITEGTPREIWGDLKIHKNETSVTVSENEVVHIGDLIVIEGE
jgi:hypothetical protein